MGLALFHVFQFSRPYLAGRPYFKTYLSIVNAAFFLASFFTEEVADVF